jgi:hypothetical protein
MQNLRETLLAGGRQARPQHVVGLVIARSPEAMEGLEPLLAAHRFLGVGHRRMLRLPAPVSLRLNILVGLVHETGVRTSRGAVVSALLRDLDGRPPEVVAEAFDRYCGLTAGQVAVGSLPEGVVLRRKRPSPGPRPVIVLSDPKRGR